MQTLLIDNYDSFSHILCHYLWEVNGQEPIFIHNDEWTLAEVHAAGFDNIVISPGPGHPGNARDFGICAQVIRSIVNKPILGVCLGLQGLGLGEGIPVVAAPFVRHGKYSRIRHDGKDLFADLPQDFTAVRYHSLVLDTGINVPGLTITATAVEDEQIMGISIADRPAFGVQFHPESIGTEHGKHLLANFRDITARWMQNQNRMRTPAVRLKRLPESASIKTEPRVLQAKELPWREPEAAFEHFFKNCAAGFWLDSLAEPVPGERRVTYMGTGERLLVVSGESVRVLKLLGTTEIEDGEEITGDPFEYLSGYLKRNVSCKLPQGIEFSGEFLGGLVGYFGYELKRFTGGGDGKGMGNLPKSDLPDALFLEPDRILAFDHTTRKAYAILPWNQGSQATANAREWFAALDSKWNFPEPAHVFLHRKSPAPRTLDALKISWRLSAPKPLYCERIRSLQQAILCGETYEACLTNELRVSSQADPFLVYKMLRRTNPAPYAAYFQFPMAKILSASPERFLKLDVNGTLICRPIKGTRPRGKDEREDAVLKSELAANAKDLSENLMIVDLVRNDFGKICRLGSVLATEMMKVEVHPTVLQLVSTVQGLLDKDHGAVDAVRACFPGGSMTGAPKVRTMELLAKEEERARGIFSGAMGYLGWDGAMDLGMVIRTLVHADGEYRIGCGGAILAESDPEAEFAEAMLKASASLGAIELAELGESSGWKVKN